LVPLRAVGLPAEKRDDTPLRRVTMSRLGLPCSVTVHMLRALSFLLLTTRLVLPCYIAGTDSGYCDPQIQADKEWRVAQLPFCAPHVKYTPCLPQTRIQPPSRHYPEGRFHNHTVLKKDEWVYKTTHEIIQTRKHYEQSRKLEKKGMNDLNESTPIKKRFYRNPDCEDAFKAYMCYINFPRCDDDGNSLIMCRSACENLMTACKYEKDLWRCGESHWFNAEKPEKPAAGGEYLRDFYPGQPFRDYGGKVSPLCTPSVKGAASRAAAPPVSQSLVLVVGSMAALLASALATTGVPH